MSPAFSYGGQAVIEGVMIRGQKGVAVAVRRPSGEIISTSEPLSNFYTGPLRKLPFVRGVLVLLETIVLGTRALMFSANAAIEDESTTKGPEVKVSTLAWVMLAVGMTAGVAFFFLVPLWLTKLLNVHSSVAFAAAEGVIRMVLFVAYIAAISLLPEMKRVFAYHGAEHMTIAAHEHGHPLDIEHIRAYPKEHPRCGTAFLITVMLVAILVFSVFGLIHPAFWMIVLSRLLFVPLIAGASYEVIKFDAMHEKALLGRILMTPGIWLQYLTTRKPDDAQIEVAVASMQTALATDGALPPSGNAAQIA